MVDVLIKDAKVIVANSQWNGKKVDILIKKGKIAEVGKGLKAKAKEISAKGLCVSLGWYDLCANFQDPGHEYKEDLISGLNCAVAGGYTRVCIQPNTTPAITDKSRVEYLINKSGQHLADVSVMGGVSKELKGEELAEVYDMHQSGATWFGDGNTQLRSGRLMAKALQYTQSFGGKLVTSPMEYDYQQKGMMHEGSVSTRLGLRGIPDIAETIAIQRDLELLNYAGGHIHFNGVSTAEGVKLIKKAKAAGKNVTASVHLMNLIGTDEMLEDYDVNLKVMPPLRSEKDRKALVKAVNAGIIDNITTNHMPQDVENKKVEFQNAAFGAIGLETSFGLYGEYLKKEIPLEIFIAAISTKAYDSTGETRPQFQTGEKANLTIFTPTEKWVYDSTQSKSKNSAFFNKKLTGKVLGVINGDQTSIKL